MYLLRVLIGSLGNLCLLWLAGIITLVLVLQQSFEKRSSPTPPLRPYFVTVVTTDTYPNAFHLIHFKCFGWCNPQPLRQQNKAEWLRAFFKHLARLHILFNQLLIRSFLIGQKFFLHWKSHFKTIISSNNAQVKSYFLYLFPCLFIYLFIYIFGFCIYSFFIDLMICFICLPFFLFVRDKNLLFQNKAYVVLPFFSLFFWLLHYSSRCINFCSKQKCSLPLHRK